MLRSGAPLSPDFWLNDLFASKAVQQGGVIRRKARDIERGVGMRRFLAELERRGFHAVENAGQVVIFCNRGPVRWLTDPPESPPVGAPLSATESGTKSVTDFGFTGR